MRAINQNKLKTKIMTFYYQTKTWNSQPQITEETINLWKHLAEKKNWRITQLPNGFYQTEYQDQNEETWNDVTRRETLEGAEQAIDSSVAHYAKKLEYVSGPKVVKTFK
ncbi:unnamed protein product [marine sediment metagenome]|uniref:Uncharacterized protein n=1 Tax=marine sediment metagenome TaxID=412755 RepID=X0T3Y0_9ZZZZ